MGKLANGELQIVRPILTAKLTASVPTTVRSTM